MENLRLNNFWTKISKSLIFSKFKFCHIGFKSFKNSHFLWFSETWICWYLAHPLLDLCTHKHHKFQPKCGKSLKIFLKFKLYNQNIPDLGLLVDHFVRSWSVFPLPRIQIRRRCWCHRFKSYRHRSFGWRSAQVLMIQKTSQKLSWNQVYLWYVTYRSDFLEIFAFLKSQI